MSSFDSELTPSSPWRVTSGESISKSSESRAASEASSSESAIPSYFDIQKMYDTRFAEEKRKWQNTLSEKLNNLISSFASGRQEIIQLKVTKHSRFLEQWFRELFSDPSFAASIGETQVLGSHGNKKVKSLYITLPETIGM